MNEQAQLPEPPQFSDEEMQRCRETGDFMPMLFEWYKFVGHVCIFFAQLQRESPTVREILPIHFAILTGLLNRCARLMLSNIALSHNGNFGETTALLDRCIFESCLKLDWLCHEGNDDSFQCYLAGGLKTEIELEKEIRGKITEREDSEVLHIEKRMLSSIDRYINAAGLSREEIIEAKKLPDVSAMLRDLGHERLMYVVAQRLGSHHVHGTWPSLLLHYLEVDDDGGFTLRDHDCHTHPNQFVMTPLQVLGAITSFIVFVIEAEDAEGIVSLLDSIQEEILNINGEMIGSDFQRS
ncbi:hypothetical protein C1752_06194 [Acaryochloris thomasi RCC1774]|uniref:Uncharacterized protein n=1 Tax=Acaryochloris thomasi RCC1774 TaxID=1764569 RepID=A0A2W1JN53_9CYAN|nr:DUF5677 domain-containing protein [Acaryochloris thomasi]PZD71574.1 hypothetical protein C1752_06194 [Acaryochloris thomasi RCC1774]